MPDIYRAIVRPLVTEKSSAAFAFVTPKGRALKEYTFRADPAASTPCAALTTRPTRVKPTGTPARNRRTRGR